MYGLPVFIPVFLGLYQFNNKYSQDTIQAANGILALSEKNFKVTGALSGIRLGVLS